MQGIGNGIPLGAVVTTPEIAEVLTRRSYFNTFGGNPLCTAAGLAVLKVMEKENLQENALVVGSYLKKRLTELKDKYESKLYHSVLSPYIFVHSPKHKKFQFTLFCACIKRHNDHLTTA